MGLYSKCDFAPPNILLGLLLCPWIWGISSKSPLCHKATAPAPHSIFYVDIFLVVKGLNTFSFFGCVYSIALFFVVTMGFTLNILVKNSNLIYTSLTSITYKKMLYTCFQSFQLLRSPELHLYTLCAPKHKQVF